MRIGAAEKIAVLLQNERRIKLGGPGYDEFRRRSDRMQQRAWTNTREWLPRSAVRAEHVVSSDATTAKSAEDSLNLNRLAAQHRRRSGLEFLLLRAVLLQARHA